MKFELNSWGNDPIGGERLAGDFPAGNGAAGNDPATIAADHWLDDALRSVPLPDGFFARLCRLSDAPQLRDEDRDHNGRFAPTRGLAGTVPRNGASNREFRSR